MTLRFFRGGAALEHALGIAYLAFAVAAFLGGVLLLAPARAQTPIRVFPLRLHVPAAEVTDAFLVEQVETANALFIPHGVGFAIDQRLVLEEAHASLETRRDRHALGALLDPTRIDVFVVRSLRDVDDPRLMRRGVHWRPAGRPGAHFVIVSAISAPSVLAHELGHYFGNPHSSTPGNIMSYDRGEVPPFFDATQSRRITRAATRFARERRPAPIERDPSASLP